MKMAGYLSPWNIDISLDEKKLLLKCRLEDIYITFYLRKKWNYCISTEMDQKHLPSCKYIMKKKQLFCTYIREYKRNCLTDPVSLGL